MRVSDRRRAALPRAVRTISFTQRRLHDRVRLESAIAAFHPRLAARPGAPAWTGELYKRVQARLHVAISRSYFRELTGGAARGLSCSAPRQPRLGAASRGSRSRRRHGICATSADADGVRWLVAHASNPTSMRAALEGIEVAYYLVHSLGAGDFAARDGRAAEIMARACENAGVRQIVNWRPSPAMATCPSICAAAARPSSCWPPARTPVTTIRAAVVIAGGSAAFETIVALVDRLPELFALVPSTPTQPIAIDDIVAYLVAVAGLEQALGTTYEAGGPEVMTYRRMIEQIAEIRGRHPLIVEEQGL